MKTSTEYLTRDSGFFSKNPSACDGFDTMGFSGTLRTWFYNTVIRLQRWTFMLIHRKCHLLCGMSYIMSKSGFCEIIFFYNSFMTIKELCNPWFNCSCQCCPDTWLITMDVCVYHFSVPVQTLKGYKLRYNSMKRTALETKSFFVIA